MVYIKNPGQELAGIFFVSWWMLNGQVPAASLCANVKKCF